MKRRTARILRRAADHLDPKPARWYASAWQQSASTSNTSSYIAGPPTMVAVHRTAADKPRRRVLADYLSSMDLKKLRP